MNELIGCTKWMKQVTTEDTGEEKTILNGRTLIKEISKKDVPRFCSFEK